MSTVASYVLLPHVVSRDGTDDLAHPDASDDGYTSLGGAGECLLDLSSSNTGTRHSGDGAITGGGIGNNTLSPAESIHCAFDDPEFGDDPATAGSSGFPGFLSVSVTGAWDLIGGHSSTPGDATVHVTIVAGSLSWMVDLTLPYDLAEWQTDDADLTLSLTSTQADELSAVLQSGGVTGSYHVDVPGSGVDQTLKVNTLFCSFFYDDEAGPVEAWPWHVVDSAANGGTVWRLGPDSNPDGGIARVVFPDGTIYVQDPDGAPLTIVDPVLGDTYPLGKLPLALVAPLATYSLGPYWDGTDDDTAFHGAGSPTNVFFDSSDSTVLLWTFDGSPSSVGAAAAVAGTQQNLSWAFDDFYPGEPGSVGTLTKLRVTLRGGGFTMAGGGSITSPVTVQVGAHTFTGTLPAAPSDVYVDTVLTKTLTGAEAAVVEAAANDGSLAGWISCDPAEGAVVAGLRLALIYT